MGNSIHDWISGNCRFILENAKMAKKHRNGLLIVFEGIDGSGKSSSTKKLLEWLEKEDYPAINTKWNSSDLVSECIDKGKDNRELTPMLFSLLHAADFHWRYENVILPALKTSRIVIADRYFYTSFVRDSLRGVKKDMLENVYADIREPDIVFHLSCPVNVAFARLMDEKGLTFYGSGMDLEISENRAESCLEYEKMMNDRYNSILPKMAKNYVKIDTNRSEKEIFDDIKEEMKKRFEIGEDS